MTPATLLLGVVIGVVMTASLAYAGLVIGFVVPASAVAAILGWGVLRGALRRGSLLENNINQTVASAINTAAAGIIFTFPALFLIGDTSFDVTAITLAAIGGAFLGTLFIIPLRKQMIDLERLRFPSGLAVAEVLRSPGAGLDKAALLGVSTLVAFLIGLVTSFSLVPQKLDLGSPLGLPMYVPFIWALSLLSLGAGFLSGRAGLVLLCGGMLANWVIAPLVVALGWVTPPATAPAHAADAAMAGVIYGSITRPLGIGFLIGGALAGVALAAPMMRAALSSLRADREGSEEMSVRWIYVGLGASFVLLTGAAFLQAQAIAPWRVLATALFGTLWIWLAGVIVAQCAGMTGWSPVSGMALLSVAVVLVLTESVALSVLIGAAVSVAIAQGADMMSDLKTGHLVGSRPAAQQLAQLSVSWLGPIVAVLTVMLIWSTVKFGPENPAIPAPQAVTLQGVIATVQGGEVPLDKYAAGALVSALLTLATGGGFGVLVGLSMYLPMYYILPYGLGCLFAIASDRWLGRSWSRERGTPIAAGLLVGDALAGVVFSLVMLSRGA